MATRNISDLPKAGEIWRCETCGMEMKVERDCACDHGMPRLECCGEPLTKS